MKEWNRFLTDQTWDKIMCKKRTDRYDIVWWLKQYKRTGRFVTLIYAARIAYKTNNQEFLVWSFIRLFPNPLATCFKLHEEVSNESCM